MPDRPAVGSTLDATTVLVGVDDTDNIASRGTGFLVQRMIAGIEEAELGRVLGATHHQLLVDPAIPYTSHNSSACLAIDQGDRALVDGPVDGLVRFCADFLETESAPGSDPGLVVAARETWQAAGVSEELVRFGHSAKVAVLDFDAAVKTAESLGVHASGHGGTHGGIIGALAAVGLHRSGSDGFFLWMPGIREFEGRPTYDELRTLIPVDAALAPDRSEPAGGDVIELIDWVRPLWVDGRAVLLVLPGRTDEPAGVTPGVWRLAPRYMVRKFDEHPGWES